MLNIALFGPPGAGKGTQAKKIIERYNLYHLSTGEIIRQEIAQGTELGIIAKDIINEGRLLSDELVVKLVEDCINHVKGVDGFLFDGFPRTVVQAEILDQMLAKEHMPLNGMLNIEVPYEELIRRMLKRAEIEGRVDDNQDVIANRFKEYDAKTVHVMNYYVERGLCYHIPGNKPEDEVFNELVGVIEKIK